MANHLLALKDFDKEQLMAYIRLAMNLKNDRRTGVKHQHLAGKTVAMIFEKPSTRTRVSFEAAMYGLAGHVIYLAARDTQLARSEPLKDMARVMSRYVDGLVVRTFGQEIVDELGYYATIPVINALTNLHHPCQILSDMMTIIEHKGAIEDLKIVWVGDGNNMANSWIQAASCLGFTLTLACPAGYEPDSVLLQEAQEKAVKPITVVHEPIAAVCGADVINTDVWASMGQEEEAVSRQKIFQPFQVNNKLLAQAAAEAVVLHCLPAHRGEEISEEVLESAASLAFDQAENKLYMHQAILLTHIG